MRRAVVGLGRLRPSEAGWLERYRGTWLPRVELEAEAVERVAARRAAGRTLGPEPGATEYVVQVQILR